MACVGSRASTFRRLASFWKLIEVFLVLFWKGLRAFLPRPFGSARAQFRLMAVCLPWGLGRQQPRGLSRTHPILQGGGSCKGVSPLGALQFGQQGAQQVGGLTLRVCPTAWPCHRRRG